ncbi:MAG: hypothetical protein ACOC56_07210 [Atribacterota bacterium]
MPCPHNKKDVVMEKLAKETKNNPDVQEVDETDGVKLYLKNGWVLMRPSGTEPIFRVYSEAKDDKTAEELALKYKKITEKIINKTK